jgi:mannose-1-phosphate guanylyltransferase
MLHAVVMAGGSGTRFWPMSRSSRPKHLLSLLGTASLLQQTVGRVTPWIAPERVLVITGADHAADVRRQLPELAARSVIAEPMRRDTAPCIGLAAALLADRDPDAAMVVLPADHVIEPAAQFRNTIEVAHALVRENSRRLVTLGIRPDRPATGYGYIQRGARIDRPDAWPVFAVSRFREKPNLETAREFVESGEFYWNSGVFVWAAAAILDEIRRSRPALAESLKTIVQAWNTASGESTLAREYARIDPISIDYAVLESSPNVVVVEAAFQWDDVGSWGAVERLKGSAPGANTVQGLHCGIDTASSIVLTDPDHLVATIGVENLIIVQCGKCTLVAHKSREESVKQLVDRLRQQGLDGFL